LDVLADLEALSSFANFAYLNPDYTYPDFIVSPSGEPTIQGTQATTCLIFDAESIGHPLVPRPKRVCNSVCLNENSKTALITGSNMAGKSTFLRTIGINLCLAYVGAPVCAARLQTAFLRTFASIRINDSVTDGFSFFYAEVKRLKTLLSAVEADHEFPVIYLIDEIFRGTNNRERFIGSRALIRTLAENAALGAIATHDLELVKLTDENRSIANFHFREEVRGDKMIFDYKLRLGPCPTTNALKIMALAGLPVSDYL
jgi:DNA mismatch repair ATPase MutS